jgi:CSLREA domain-containing protein
MNSLLLRKERRFRFPARHFVYLALVLLTNACTFRVNSVVDAPDANPGDGTCESAAGLCTLRAAVMEANAYSFTSRIEIPSGLYELTLPVNSGGGRLEITTGVKFQGAGATIIDGHGSDIVIYVKSGNVAINNLIVQGGNSQAGGGIRVDGATVEFNNLTIKNNNAFTGGGGLYVTNAGKVTIRRSTISDNFATGAFGGGIWNQGELWVYDSTIANNDANRTGGIRNEGQMNLRNTTVSGNVAHSSEAGTGGISQNGFAVLYNVTVTNNTGVGNNAGSFRGGGLQTTAGNTTVLKNSIIAGNHGGTGPNDCVGALSGDSKYNLIGDPNGCIITLFLNTYASYNGTPACLQEWAEFSDMTAVACLDPVDAQLGPLGNNGGPTQTHLPAALSKALEKGYSFPPPAVDACEGRDQRGVPRPQGSGVCDLGAVEVTNANTFVTGLVLVDAAANTDIRPLLHGDTLFLGELPSQLSVRAVVTGLPGSVVFGYDNAPSFQTENVSPYALGGDSPAGDYIAVPLSPGAHTVTATPFAAMAGAGAAGGSYIAGFEVRQGLIN